MTDDLERVRQLLLGEEYDELLRLKDELRDDGRFADHVARIVTEALKARAASDDSVAKVLAPTIDQAIAGSINQDPHKLAESLYPIMGPAIRKSITETLQSMLENFNQLLEQSLSPQSLRWRFDAWRTGRSYSELVLLNTLEYQVEQIFLIHRETSLLIQHVFSELTAMKDPDMVSGMFSAIQDFIEDSFSTNEGDVLDTLRLGDLTVVVERGPQAILAAVVRGRVPEELRAGLASNLEGIHRLRHDKLVDYDGDPDGFSDFGEDLRELLVAKQRAERERKMPWLALVALTVFAGFAGYWGYLERESVLARRALVSSLESQPGLVVLEATTGAKGFEITLLTDPDSGDPARLLAGGLPRDEPVVLITHSHLSADDAIIAERARRRLAPEPGTLFSVEGGVLKLQGRSTVQWLRKFDAAWPTVVGVQSVDLTALERRDPVRARMEALGSRIEAIEFTFDKGASTLEEDAASASDLLNAVLELQRTTLAETGVPARLDIIGFTDESGSATINRRIGQRRAESVKALLVEGGVDPDLVTTYNAIDFADGATSNERETRLIVHLDNP